VGSQHHAPAALHPGKTRYPLYRRLGGPQGRSGRVRKISPPPGFDSSTVQPVASRCTDWAIWPLNIDVCWVQIIELFIVQFCPVHCYVICLRPKYPPQYNTVERPQPVSFPQWERPNLLILIEWIVLIYMFTAIGLTPGGSNNVHRTTQWHSTYIIRIYKHNNKSTCYTIKQKHTKHTTI
jgi:hypothetical protein